MQKLKALIKDPGILFSVFHTITFAATAGVASPAFALGLLSLGVATGFKTRQIFQQGQNDPTLFINKKGAPMFVNGAILSGVAGLSMATGAWVPAAISTFFSISNASKGLEMNGSPYSLKALGQKYFSHDKNMGALKNTGNSFVRNTVFSAEFLASAGAFTVGLAGAGGWALAGVAISGSALTLAALSHQVQGERPTWREIAKRITPEQLSAGLDRVPTLRNLRSLNISDPTVVRGAMAAASATYGIASALSASPQGKWLALGQVFAASANVMLTKWQFGNDNKPLEGVLKPPAPQDLPLGQQEQKPHPAPGM